jgi:hypothetical protein
VHQLVLYGERRDLPREIDDDDLRTSRENRKNRQDGNKEDYPGRKEIVRQVRE